MHEWNEEIVKENRGKSSRERHWPCSMFIGFSEWERTASCKSSHA